MSIDKVGVLEWLRRSKIVPVVRASSPEDALQMVDALVEGGINVLEITMTIPSGIEVIRDLSTRPNLLVGAGTVLDAATAESCIEAGAKFVVSPALDVATVRFCNQASVLVAPGALTPTEILAAHKAGGDVIKVFPCDALGGAQYLRSLRAPLPHIPLMPTGGVTLATIRDFLSTGAIAVGIGSALADPKLSTGELVERARAFRDTAEVS